MADLNSIASIWAIVPAAGVGSRMGSTVRKQYMKLGDRTLLEHSIARLQAASISRIVVPVARDDNLWRGLSFGGGGQPCFIEGGSTRAESVLRGVEYVADQSEPECWILVHDAVRPCIRPDEIAKLIAVAGKHDVGGLLATRVTDTLKIARASANGARESGDGLVERTPDRDGYWRAQTPQMFRQGLLLEALRVAISREIEITDEAQAIELLGHTPLLVEGRDDNIKVTTPTDLELAGFLLARQRSASGEGTAG